MTKPTNLYLERAAQVQPRMWRHFCTAEGLPLAVGAGERCSWCDKSEVQARFQNLAGRTAPMADAGLGPC